MSPRLPRSVRWLAPLALIALLGAGAAKVARAQVLPTDAPILLSEEGSTRALAARPRGSQAPLGPVVIAPGEGSRVTIYVVRLESNKDANATAFRAFIEDVNHHQIYLPVESVEPTADRDWVYAVTLRLTEDVGDVGDVLVGVTWRGMLSNRVRLAIGHAGGGPADDEFAAPTPMPKEAPIYIATGDDNGDGTNYVGRLISPDRVRFMEQASFGPTSDLDAQIRRMGMSAWIADQQTMPYPTIPYPAVIPEPLNPPAGCTSGTDCFRDQYSQHLLQRWFFSDALYGNDQLRRRVAWALHKMIVTSGALDETVQANWTLQYIKVLDRNAFGNFKTLLTQMTLNPNMGNYLDMVRSTKGNPNENYAREILQLFSVGLYNLNQDGTIICVEHNPCQAGDTPSPTYDQNVVNGFTKIFTGWNTCNAGPPTCPNGQAGIPNFIDDLVLTTANHDTTSKVLLGGVTQPASQTGAADMTAAINNIFNHPNVAPFVSKQLIQNLVTSDPTPLYVARVAAVFNNNGAGVRGDLGAVVRAILMDPEARGDLKTDPMYGHLKEPVLFTANVLRRFNVRAANGVAGSQSDGYLNPQTTTLSQNVWNPTTVFSYYSPDYTVAASNPLVRGPEFGIMTTTTSLKRANLINTLAFSTIAINGTNGPNGTSIDLTELQTLSASDATGALLVDTLNQRMLHGSMSAQARASILTAVTTVASSNTLLRAQTAFYLVASSSQYQVER
jgi:uncharacterized protein (DUF1800 family)